MIACKAPHSPCSSVEASSPVHIALSTPRLSYHGLLCLSAAVELCFLLGDQLITTQNTVSDAVIFKSSQQEGREQSGQTYCLHIQATLITNLAGSRLTRVRVCK